MAIRFQDRIVQYPNRVKLTPVAGQVNTYDVSRVEGNVTAEGTALNRENLENGFLSLYEGGELTKGMNYGVYFDHTGLAAHVGYQWLWRLDENGLTLRDAVVTNVVNNALQISEVYSTGKLTLNFDSGLTFQKGNAKLSWSSSKISWDAFKNSQATSEGTTNLTVESKKLTAASSMTAPFTYTTRITKDGSTIADISEGVLYLWNPKKVKSVNLGFGYLKYDIQASKVDFKTGSTVSVQSGACSKIEVSFRLGVRIKIRAGSAPGTAPVIEKNYTSQDGIFRAESFLSTDGKLWVAFYDSTDNTCTFTAAVPQLTNDMVVELSTGTNSMSAVMSRVWI